MEPIYLCISQEKTGRNIRRLIKKNGYSVQDIQELMGFESPRAIYKWMAGRSLPSIESLVVLSRIFHTYIDSILVTEGDAVMEDKLAA